MKVRISGNNIRLRLKEPEVNRFAQVGFVSEVLAFGADAGDCLTFTLATGAVNQVTIAFAAQETKIIVPEVLARSWTKSGLVGFEANLDTGKGKTIGVLIEKDFVCL